MSQLITSLLPKAAFVMCLMGSGKQPALYVAQDYHKRGGNIFTHKRAEAWSCSDIADGQEIAAKLAGVYNVAPKGRFEVKQRRSVPATLPFNPGHV